jgi:hypothetical protein
VAKLAAINYRPITLPCTDVPAVLPATAHGLRPVSQATSLGVTLEVQQILPPAGLILWLVEATGWLIWLLVLGP